MYSQKRHEKITVLLHNGATLSVENKQQICGIIFTIIFQIEKIFKKIENWRKMDKNEKREAKNPRDGANLLSVLLFG